MKTLLFILISLSLLSKISSGQHELEKGEKLQQIFHFSAAIAMEANFYDKNEKLIQTTPFETLFSHDFQQSCIRQLRGKTMYETIFDQAANKCYILIREGENSMGSVAEMKDRSAKKPKILPLEATGERKQVAGFECSKFRFATDEFSGELWITQALDWPNEAGVFKVSKMGKYYQQIDVQGFILEISTITPKGKKTRITTYEVKPVAGNTIKLPEGLGRAINKVDYDEY